MVLAVRRTKIASSTSGEAPFRRELNTPVTSDPASNDTVKIRFPSA